MAKPKKITQNINKDAGLMDLPKVRVPHSTWETKSSNYLTCNIGDIVPIFVDEVLPSEKRKMTMGMLSHMSTPIAPIFNAQYTELRSFFVPYRLCADLLAGYKTRKSPWVKVFGEDNASSSANIIVPLAQQKLPDVSDALDTDFFQYMAASTFGGLGDALGYDDSELSISDLNLLDFAAYELIYQSKYRNQNRESSTESKLYKWLFDIYNRANASSVSYNGADDFHKANREKDYFTGAEPFTQKGDPIEAHFTSGEAKLKAKDDAYETGDEIQFGSSSIVGSATVNSDGSLVRASGNLTSPRMLSITSATEGSQPLTRTNLVVDLSSMTGGLSIEQLRVLIKTQELLEKDAIWGSSYCDSLNSHFGTCPISLVLEEPLELRKISITSEMQAIFQTSSTSGEDTILGTIGANATTQSKDIEIVPWTEFKEHGLLMICAVHKAQNSYDAIHYHPKRIFKKNRFDFYTPELNDLGYAPVSRLEFRPGDYEDSKYESVGFNEAFAEYRFKVNFVHGMFEPSRVGALDYWTLAISSYTDIQSLYKQTVTELDRAISIKSTVAPQFFDAYGFVEVVSKPMSLHSIPGMDGVI